MMYDLETQKMIIQDFLRRQRNLVMNEMLEVITKNFVDVSMAKENMRCYFIQENDL